MSKKKWTPGPWKVEKLSYDSRLHCVFTKTGDSVFVARTAFAPGSEANAHLISAAPDLYEALKSVEWNGFSHDESPYTCPCCSREKYLGHASDCKLAVAFSKAEGKKP